MGKNACIPVSLKKEKIILHNFQNVIFFCIHALFFFSLFFRGREGSALVLHSLCFCSSIVDFCPPQNQCQWSHLCLIIWEVINVIIYVLHSPGTVGLLIRLDEMNSVGPSSSWCQGKKVSTSSHWLNLAKWGHLGD